MDLRRARRCSPFEYKDGAILYWMNRDQRVNNNWALLCALGLAKKYNAPLVVLFNLDPTFLGGGLRQLTFKVQGLQEVQKELQKYDIPFYLLTGENTDTKIVDFIKEHDIGAVVTDFFPIHISKKWLNTLKKQLHIPILEVDTHNIVPTWIASDKLEFAAYTLRPKLHRLLPEYLLPFPEIPKLDAKWQPLVPDIAWDDLLTKTNADPRIQPIPSYIGGESHAQTALEAFLEERLPIYHEKRNNPALHGQSDLSPYLHYGHISAQQIALEVQKSDAPQEAKSAFLEELIVRRELADNFCHYNPDYDSTKGFHAWAQKTMEEHRHDPREYLYSEENLNDAKTHDELWNTAQREMRYLGKMHGFMRMYWAKKLLEWTTSPEEALRIGILFNDRYELDGRDPNGYAGLAWSIGGVHDRAWGEREIFGKIRYMNYNGCKRKFSIPEYCKYVEDAIDALQK